MQLGLHIAGVWIWSALIGWPVVGCPLAGLRFQETYVQQHKDALNAMMESYKYTLFRHG